MKATVCELPAAGSRADREEAWAELVAHVGEAGSELVLLPEMPFHRWICAAPEPDPAAWNAAVAAHDRWLERLDELGGGAVAGSRPVVDGGLRYNEGFVWDPDRGYRAVQRKRHLPDESGFWEASWYEPGRDQFGPAEVKGGLRVGFLICTDVWFGRHARELGEAGAHVVLCPRATPAETLEKWVVGGRTAAVVAGAWCLSSNFSGRGGTPGHELEFAGGGWIVEPERGDVVGVTGRETPFLTVDIDIAAAEDAKGTYPRYVR